MSRMIMTMIMATSANLARHGRLATSGTLCSIAFSAEATTTGSVSAIPVLLLWRLSSRKYDRHTHETDIERHGRDVFGRLLHLSKYTNDTDDKRGVCA